MSWNQGPSSSSSRRLQELNQCLLHRGLKKLLLNWRSKSHFESINWKRGRQKPTTNCPHSSKFKHTSKSLMGLIPNRVMISRPFVKKMMEKIKEFYHLSKKLKDRHPQCIKHQKMTTLNTEGKETSSEILKPWFWSRFFDFLPIAIANFLSLSSVSLSSI